MDSHKKKSFVAKAKRQKFARGGLAMPMRPQHFDDGGTVHTQGGPMISPIRGGTTGLTQENASNPATGIFGNINEALGLNDKFQAGSALITPGTNVDQLNQSYQDAIDALHNSTDYASIVSPGGANGMNAQNQLLNQEMAMSSGEGPNPALAQLHQQTGQNIAGQAALMAGQRGANANAGLMARQIANQGANIQQNAVGQEATLAAQQQIAAQQRAEGLAGTQVAQGQAGVNAANTAAQNEQSTLQGANTAANNAAVGMQSNINSTNAQTAIANQDMGGKMFGAITGGASSAFGGSGGQSFAGGLAKMFSKGGEIDDPHRDHVSKFLFSDGGEVPAMVSPGERYLSPEQVKGVIHEGHNPMKVGQLVPGKAKKKGDSYANDTVPATLQDGGVVIPRHITGIKDKKMAAEKAELFVHRALARKKAARK